MNYIVKLYENTGNGFEFKYKAKMSNSESKELMRFLKSDGYVRVRGSGVIGITMELNDLEKNIQITFEREV